MEPLSLGIGIERKCTVPSGSGGFCSTCVLSASAGDGPISSTIMMDLTPYLYICTFSAGFCSKYRHGQIEKSSPSYFRR